MTLRYILFIVISSALLGCECHQNSIPLDVENVEVITVDVEAIEDLSVIRLSNFAKLQSQGSTVFLTLPRSRNDTILYKWSPDVNSIKGLFRAGRGPGEVLQVLSGARSYSDSRIFFYCSATAKFLIHNDDNRYSEMSLPHELFLFSGTEFAISGDYFAFELSAHGEKKEKLLAIYHMPTNSISYHVDIRIPFGYEPSSRNLITASAGIPEGFAFSFLGDKEVIFLDHSGKITAVVQLGENDPLPSPYILPEGVRAEGGRPYISKLEYKNGLLYILFMGEVYKLDLENLELKGKFEMRNQQGEAIKPILDFTISESIMVIRAIGNEAFWSSSLQL